MCHFQHSFRLLLLFKSCKLLFQASVSMKRLQKFVTADELDLNNVDRSPRAGPAISVENGTFAWEKDSEPTLKE